MKATKKLSIVTADKDKITVIIGPGNSNQDRAQVCLLSAFGGTFLWDMQGENLECFLSRAPVEDLIKYLFGAVWFEIHVEKYGHAYQTRIIQIMQSAIQAELWENEEGMADE